MAGIPTDFGTETNSNVPAIYDDELAKEQKQGVQRNITRDLANKANKLADKASEFGNKISTKFKGEKTVMDSATETLDNATNLLVKTVAIHENQTNQSSEMLRENIKISRELAERLAKFEDVLNKTADVLATRAEQDKKLGMLVEKKMEEASRARSVNSMWNYTVDILKISGLIMIFLRLKSSSEE